MKKIIILPLLALVPFFLLSQANIPAAYLKDSMPALIRRTSDLLNNAYMAQKLLTVTDTLPGWGVSP